MQTVRTLSAPLAAFAAVSAAALSGCLLGPDHERPSAEGLVPEAFAAAPVPGGGAADDPSPAASAAADARWWGAWSDPAVARLVSEACATNLSLAQAGARVRQARATLGAARAALRPTLGLSGSASANKAYDPDSSSRSVRAGADAGWELDLFGANRRAAEAAGADAEAAEAEEAAARLSLRAETASAYVELRLAEALLDISRENLALAEDSLEIARAKDASGMEAGAGLAAAEASVAGARAAVPAREAAASAARRAVEALLARPPMALEDALSAGAGSIPEAPDPPAVAPAGVLARRPDVRKAEAQLHAATARVGAARAARYPSVNLAAGAALSASSLDDWERSTALSAGPSVSLPLFRGGALAAAEERARAAADEALLAWRGAVLSAVHEAQDAWTRFSSESARRADLDAAAAKEVEALDAATALWKAGSGGYEAVLSRRQALLSARQNVAQNAADRALLVLSLYKVLGGAP